jgi:secreted PhoX family phosphatase
MKDRNIDNNQSGLTRLNAKQYDVILQALSRRKFLTTSSAALAMTALAGATALRGQERSSVPSPKSLGFRRRSVGCFSRRERSAAI